MRKYLLYVLAISFVFFLTSVIHSAEEFHINLRSSYSDLSVSQVWSMPNIYIYNHKVWGFYGHSTIRHEYEQKAIGADRVVVDNATSLMWHQSGARKYVEYMKYKKAKKWLEKLNRKGYAGYHDWRLPTVEEATSLLESSKKNGILHIDPVFSNKQKFIWTGDHNGSEYGWGVNFILSSVYLMKYIDNINYVRPVRSVE